MNEPSAPDAPAPTVGEVAPPVEPTPAAEAAAEETPGGYRVALPTFEGPLDLLLHLIEEHELDIFDIPIAFVAAKFVEYVTLMQELNIDVASEYLVMAATLAHIKSKQLLPVVPEDQEDEQEAEIDPRAELVRRLLEYQKYKHAAEQLAAAPVLGRDVFTHGVPGLEAHGPARVSGLSLFKLLDAFQVVLSRAKATVEHQIDFERFSITDRINQLSEILRERKRLGFIDLFEGQTTRSDIIITFLALLEMTRLRLTRLFQDDALGPIEIELSVQDDLTYASEIEGESAATDYGAEDEPEDEPAGERGDELDEDSSSLDADEQLEDYGSLLEDDEEAEGEPPDADRNDQ
jgi:segregation and condensation protein A